MSDKELTRYNDIRAYTSMNGSNLEVLSSEEYSGARREFNDEDWKGATGIVSRYYNLVLADCGAGLFQPASRGVLSTVSGLVIVASASIDGARQAAVTMDWLRQNGYQDLLGRSCVVINHVVPGKPNIDVADLVQQFERHVPPGPRHRAAVGQAHRGGHRDPTRPAGQRRSSAGSSSWPRRCPTTSTGSNAVDHHRRRTPARRASRPAGRRPPGSRS